MSEPTRQRTVQRILVALDESPHSAAALEAAAELAVRLRAELEALYVEDVNLLRLASLPFAREITGASGAARRLDAAQLERAMRAQGERLQQLLQTVAARVQVPSRLQVVRGNVARELLARAPEVDLMILGRAGQSGYGRRVGSIARAVTSQATCTVLVLQQDMVVGRPVVVLFDGSPAARRALMLATQVAEHDGHNLRVLLPAGNPAHAAELQAAAEELLRPMGCEARIEPLADNSPARIAAVVRQLGAKLLVLDAQNPLWQHGSEAASLLESVDCPVVLAR